MSMKLFLLRCAKQAGVFGLARLMTRRKLRILCYHGFQISDETRFRPKLFIEGDEFGKRLQILKRSGCTVLPLQDAVDRLYSGTLPDYPVVLTMDDGWYSSYNTGVPVAERFGFPLTIYVTSYYVEKQCPIFRLAIQYMFWKTSRQNANGCEWPWRQSGSTDLSDSTHRDKLMWQCIEYGEGKASQAERDEIALRIGQDLGVPYGDLVNNRSMSLMTPNEIRDATGRGVDIQLHTHRHTFKLGNGDSLRAEVSDNIVALQQWTGGVPRHFCYPSGQWDASCPQVLEQLGILSATTCDSGFNTRTTHRHALCRFLDGSNISEIEFEAELSGVLELARIVRKRLRLNS
jgi:peptidoglycan/xylan/chitin deacetylase (PgdA/CDA1 family)